MSRFPSEAIVIISRQLGPAPTRVLLENLEKAGFSILKEPTLEELLELARNHVMSPAEREAQRQSWNAGELAMGESSVEVRGAAFLGGGRDGVPVPCCNRCK